MPIPLLALMAAGAIAGAATNKKDRLKGALMGAGLGATGGLLAPAAAGAAGAAGAGTAAAGGAAATGAAASGAAAAAPTMVNGAFLGEGIASGIPAWQAASTGVSTSGGLLGTMSQYGKPAMQMAQQSGLMGGQEEQPQASPFISQASGGQQTLAQVAQQGGLLQDQLASMEQKRRQRRMGLLGREMA